MSEPFPGEALIAEGWVYRDLPRMTPDAFDKFIGILLHQNARWLTFARYPDGAVRGQLLISPAGMKRLAEHSALPTENTQERDNGIT